MIQRGDIYWVDLGEPEGSTPAGRRPVLVIQSDGFNRSRLRTVLVAALTSNIQLEAKPGNVLLAADDSGLPRDSVVNVTQLVTLDRYDLAEHAGSVPSDIMVRVDDGLRLALGI